MADDTEPVAPEQPAAGEEPDMAVWPLENGETPGNGNGDSPAVRHGWFEQPEREADGEPPEEHPGGDRLVATLNHGGWGPPADAETTGPLDSTMVDGPPQDHHPDEPGDR